MRAVEPTDTAGSPPPLRDFYPRGVAAGVAALYIRPRFTR